MPQKSFLLLSLIGFYLLWAVMYLNGTVTGLFQAVSQSQFADGSPLRVQYLHIPPIDHAIAVLVAFFDGMTNGQDPGAWLLMLDFLASLQTAAICVFIEGFRVDEKLGWLKSLAVWGLLWNGFGAGFVIPLYFYFHGTTASNSRMISQGQAKALPSTAFVMAFLPAAVVLSAPFVSRSSSSHQVMIALFQATPLFIELFHYVLASLFSVRAIAIGKSTTPHPFIRITLAFSGLVSGLVHVATMLVSMFTSDPRLAYNRVFVPHAGNVVSGAVDGVHEGALLFLQYDWIMVNLACCLWVGVVSKGMGGKTSVVQVVGWVALALGIGPGAMLCVALWWREDLLELEQGRQESARRVPVETDLFGQK